MPTVTCPYGRQSLSSGAVALPAYPIDQPVSEIGKEGLRLVQEAREATRKLGVVRDTQQDAASRYRAARAAYEAEVQRGGQTGKPDLGREHELSLELSAAERACDPQTHQIRQQAALAEQRRLASRAQVWLWENWPAILEEELRDEAEMASAELVEAYASIQHSVDRYQSIRRRVSDLVGITLAGPHAAELSSILALGSEPQPPLPSDDGVATFIRATTSERVSDEPLREMPPGEEPILTRANVLFGA